MKQHDNTTSGNLTVGVSAETPILDRDRRSQWCIADRHLDNDRKDVSVPGLGYPAYLDDRRGSTRPLRYPSCCLAIVTDATHPNTGYPKLVPQDLVVPQDMCEAVAKMVAQQ